MAMLKAKKGETTGTCTQIIKMLFSGLMILSLFNYAVLGDKMPKDPTAIKKAAKMKKASGK
jgi:hypothetical protein